jgi:hypothetical protein
MRFSNRSSGVGRVSSLLPHAYSLLWSPARFFEHAYWERDTAQESIDPRWRYVEEKLNGARLTHLEYLRSESLRLRAATDIDTLSALLIGRIEFRYTPERPEVQAIFERIWHDDVAALTTIAVRDYLVAGVGGLALTPLGVSALRPELTIAYPNWHRFEWIARLVIVPEHYLEHVLGRKGLSLYRKYQAGRTALRNRDENESVNELPSGLPCIEIYDGYKLSYYVNGRLMQTHELGGRYNYFLLVGEERTVDEDYVNMVSSGMSASYPHFTSFADYVGLQRVQSYPEDWTENGIELPVGMLERCVRSVYRGYNLYEAHEKLVESILKEALKGRWAFYRFDAFDTESLAFQEFESIFNAIGYNWEDAFKGSPVTFAGGVNLQELQIGLRELEQIITSVTGVSPYMLGVVGVTRVASEVVASQQHTNVKLSVQQERVAQMLARFVRAYQFYLASLPEQFQRVYLEPIDMDGQLRYIRLGPVNQNTPYLPMIEEVDYLDFFSRCRIDLAYTGQLSLNERRQNYMQAIQLLASMLQVLMQTGSIYRLEPIIDRLLKDFGVDLREVKQPPAPAGVLPASDASAGAAVSSPMDTLGVPTSLTPETATNQHVPLEAVLQMLNSGAITEDDAISLLSPESIAQLEQMVQSDTL